MDGWRAVLHNSNIGRSLPARRSVPMNARLPTYALYGETGGKSGLGVDIGWLHCESIAERSRLHDWEIGAHRHESLFQLLVIRSGSCDTTLDGQRLKLRGPCLVTVPAL